MPWSPFHPRPERLLPHLPTLQQFTYPQPASNAQEDTGLLAHALSLAELVSTWLQCALQDICNHVHPYSASGCQHRIGPLLLPFWWLYMIYQTCYSPFEINIEPSVMLYQLLHLHQSSGASTVDPKYSLFIVIIICYNYLYQLNPFSVLPLILQFTCQKL